VRHGKRVFNRRLDLPQVHRQRDRVRFLYDVVDESLGSFRRASPIAVLPFNSKYGMWPGAKEPSGVVIWHGASSRCAKFCQPRIDHTLHLWLPLQKFRHLHRAFLLVHHPRRQRRQAVQSARSGIPVWQIQRNPEPPQ
jgi:hypothetical protein